MISDRWAIFSHPPKLGLGRNTFVQSYSRLKTQNTGLRTQDSGLGLRAHHSSFLAGGEGCIEELLCVAGIRLGLKVNNESLGNAVCGI
jgi:hypothetical protein